MNDITDIVGDFTQSFSSSAAVSSSAFVETLQNCLVAFMQQYKSCKVELHTCKSHLQSTQEAVVTTATERDGYKERLGISNKMLEVSYNKWRVLISN